MTRLRRLARLRERDEQVAATALAEARDRTDAFEGQRARLLAAIHELAAERGNTSAAAIVSAGLHAEAFVRTRRAQDEMIEAARMEQVGARAEWLEARQRRRSLERLDDRTELRRRAADRQQAEREMMDLLRSRAPRTRA